MYIRTLKRIFRFISSTLAISAGAYAAADVFHGPTPASVRGGDNVSSEAIAPDSFKAVKPSDLRVPSLGDSMISSWPVKNQRRKVKREEDLPRVCPEFSSTSLNDGVTVGNELEPKTGA